MIDLSRAPKSPEPHSQTVPHRHSSGFRSWCEDSGIPISGTHPHYCTRIALLALAYAEGIQTPHTQAAHTSWRLCLDEIDSRSPFSNPDTEALLSTLSVTLENAWGVPTPSPMTIQSLVPAYATSSTLRASKNTLVTQLRANDALALYGHLFPGAQASWWLDFTSQDDDAVRLALYLANCRIAPDFTPELLGTWLLERVARSPGNILLDIKLFNVFFHAGASIPQEAYATRFLQHPDYFPELEETYAPTSNGAYLRDRLASIPPEAAEDTYASMIYHILAPMRNRPYPPVRSDLFIEVFTRVTSALKDKSFDMWLHTDFTFRHLASPFPDNTALSQALALAPPPLAKGLIQHFVRSKETKATYGMAGI